MLVPMGVLMKAASSLNSKQRKTTCKCGRSLRLTNTDGVCGACALKGGLVVGVLGREVVESRDFNIQIPINKF